MFLLEGSPAFFSLLEQFLGNKYLVSQKGTLPLQGLQEHKQFQ